MKLLKIQIFFLILRCKMFMTMESFKSTTTEYSVNVSYCSKPLNFYWLSKTTARFYSWKNIHATGNCYSNPNDEGIRMESESTGLSFLATWFKSQVRQQDKWARGPSFILQQTTHHKRSIHYARKILSKNEKPWKQKFLTQSLVEGHCSNRAKFTRFAFDILICKGIWVVYDLLFPANDPKMEASINLFNFIAWWKGTKRNASHYWRSYWKYRQTFF